MKRIISALLAVLMLAALCLNLAACDLGSLAEDLVNTVIDEALSEGEDSVTDGGDDGIVIIDADDQQNESPDIGGTGEDDAAEPADEPSDLVIPDETADGKQPESPADDGITVDKDGEYDDKDHVALYIHLYGKLPKNYMTKKQAEAKGWTGGALDTVVKGKAIGGTYFGNYEGLLPKKDKRSYYECDIDTIGKKSRGAKRIIYSNDGLVYYTDDHYETFTLLYGEE